MDIITTKLYNSSMEKAILYHGSERVIEKPIFGYKNNVSDYGNGFYCTQDIESAKEWANRKTNQGYVNQYSFDARGLRILDLTSPQYSFLHWITLLIKNRLISDLFVSRHQREIKYLLDNYDTNINEYDVVIGYRADDAYFKFPIAFIDSRIPIEKCEEIYSLGNLGVQVVLISKKAFTKISFIKAIEVDYVYQDKYRSIIEQANSRYEQIVEECQYIKGTRLIDLVRDQDD